LHFYLSDTIGMVPDAELDQTKPCPTSASCIDGHWNKVYVGSFFSAYVIEAAKRLKECESPIMKVNTLSKDTSATE
jgi:hypothetical protein